MAKGGFRWFGYAFSSGRPRRTWSPLQSTLPQSLPKEGSWDRLRASEADLIASILSTRAWNFSYLRPLLLRASSNDLVASCNLASGAGRAFALGHPCLWHGLLRRAQYMPNPFPKEGERLVPGFALTDDVLPYFQQQSDLARGHRALSNVLAFEPFGMSGRRFRCCYWSGSDR